MIRGIVWQPDDATLDPQGIWDRLGAHELIIQWAATPGRSFLGVAGTSPSPDQTDLEALSRQPWARSVIVGLAGDPDESQARLSVSELAARSAKLAQLSKPLTVSGWYFPVELDPTWQDPTAFREALGVLPHPLWISVYDSVNVGPNALIAQIERAVPPDVGLLFQDGVGVYARTPQVARTYLDALTRAFGRTRVRVIAEAFRATSDGFRSATPCELATQIETYRGFDIYLFDGPHYLPHQLTVDLVERLKKAPGKASCEGA